MNFFEAQDRARKNTTRLFFLLFIAASVLLVFANFVAFLISYFFLSDREGTTFINTDYSLSALQNYYPWEMFLVISVFVFLLIITGSMIKMINLSDGGDTVARMLGGRLIQGGTAELKPRRLLNVVEEMAIAAGMTVPRVYLLDDSSINAFAAGRSPANAVIGVTQGTLARLNRDELQAVIAHEFSHILNGDMLLNLRLTGLVHGIVLLGSSGYYMLSGKKQPGEERVSPGPFIYVIGMIFLVAGYVGTILGQWIKAAIGRQREYLADASAVQFTRNKDGILGALKKIGGLNTGSFIESPTAPEYSHAYFADGIRSVWQSLNATHPPLPERIRKIEPNWDGVYVDTEFNQPVPSDLQEATVSKLGAELAITTAILTSAEQAISQIGVIREENVEYVHQLIQQIPQSLRNAAQNSYTARAVVYVLLIREQPDRTEAWKSLLKHADKRMTELSMELFDTSDNLDARYKLPLLELCINALTALSTNQYIEFERSVNQIIMLDNKVELNEWVMQRLVLQQLDEYFNLRTPAKARYSSLGAVKNSAEILLSLIAYFKHKDDNYAKQVFDQAMQKAKAHGLNFIPRKAFSLDRFNQSLDELMQLKPLVKPQILKACVEIILVGGKATIREIELVRTISSCLDIPMPPMHQSSIN